MEEEKISTERERISADQKIKRMKMQCQHCKKDFEDRNLHEHHIHPKFMDNKNGLGKKIYLCQKCHNILHLIIPSIYWNLLSKEQKQQSIEKVLYYSKKYGNVKWK